MITYSFSQVETCLSYLVMNWAIDVKGNGVISDILSRDQKMATSLEYLYLAFEMMTLKVALFIFAASGNDSLSL